MTRLLKANYVIGTPRMIVGRYLNKQKKKKHWHPSVFLGAYTKHKMVSTMILPLHSLVFYSNEICYIFRSFLVNLGHFQFTSSIATTLLVEIVMIQCGCHIVCSCTASLEWDVCVISHSSSLDCAMLKA